MRKIFIGFRPLCAVFHPVMPAGQLFYRAYGCNKNIFLLTIPALVQDVINNGVLCGAVYGNLKVNARLFLTDMDGLFFPVDVAEPQCPDVATSQTGVQRQQENCLIPLVYKAVRLIFQKVCFYLFVNRSNDLVTGLADFGQSIRKGLAGCVTGICRKPQELFQDTQFRLEPFQVPVLEPVCLEIVQKVLVPYIGKFCNTYAFQIKKKPAGYGTAIYGGLSRETLLRQYREDLERAERLGAQYVVFHVSDVSMEECFTYRFSHSNDQVITAALELINELLTGKQWTFVFLVENQWWPGFTFTEPSQTQRLLDGIHYANKGILLDTGHLMNCCAELQNQAEGAAYISAILDRHGSLCSMIRGIHFHQSLSGSYVKSHTGRLPKAWPASFEERFAVNYAHVLQIDQHQPWTDAAILPVLERIKPAWLTHELTSRTREKRASAIAVQQALLQKKESAP